MLGERIRWRRAMATLVGFGGVLIMLRPGGDLWTPVVALLLVATLVMALTRIMTRQLTTTESPECQAFWLLIAHTVTGLVLLPSFPGSGLAIQGRLAGWGWCSWAFLERAGALRVSRGRLHGLAPVSALAPYEYSMMPFAIVFGFVLFSDVPSWLTCWAARRCRSAASGSYNAPIAERGCGGMVKARAGPPADEEHMGPISWLMGMMVDRCSASLIQVSQQ